MRNIILIVWFLMGCDVSNYIPDSSASDSGVGCDGVCRSTTTCDEFSDVCVGCNTNNDCPARYESQWDECLGNDGVGEESRFVYTFACIAGACVRYSSSEMRACILE